MHLHYILWKRGAPRFDLQAAALLDRAHALQKAGLVAGGEVSCDVKHVVDFFSDYINEWDPNKSCDGVQEGYHFAQRVNEASPHTASLPLAELKNLLRAENAHERFAYYSQAVQTEHLHDFHYPDPKGPPNPAQPCAKLLKGTLNMWYCANGYPQGCCMPGAGALRRPGRAATGPLAREPLPQLPAHEYQPASADRRNEETHEQQSTALEAPSDHVLLQVLQQTC